MNAIVPFAFEDQPVRVIEIDGQPWFVLADVCALLSIRNPSQAAARLDASERSMFSIGRQGDTIVVSLAGLLTIMLRCKGAMKPETIAYRVRKWITGEVVPTVMRTGSYGQPRAIDLDDAATLQRLLIEHTGRTVAADERIAVLEPKAEALERFAHSEGSLAPTAAAKTLGVRPGRLFDWLEANRWLYRGADGLLGYQAKIDQGLIEHKPLTLDRGRRSPKVVTQALVTAKGLARLAEVRAGL